MCFRIGRVGKLLEDGRTRDFGLQCFGLFHRSGHSFAPRGEDDLGSQCGEEFAAFGAHRFGHGQDQAVSAYGGDHGQAYAGVAAGGFDQHGSGSQATLLLGAADHFYGGAVLGAAGGVEVFQFGDQVRAQMMPLFEAGEFQQRGVAHQVG